MKKFKTVTQNCVVLVELPDCELARIVRRFILPRPLPKECDKDFVEAIEAMNVAEALSSWAKTRVAKMNDKRNKGN